LGKRAIDAVQSVLFPLALVATFIVWLLFIFFDYCMDVIDA
jgi:hypothetical protein